MHKSPASRDRAHGARTRARVTASHACYPDTQPGPSQAPCTIATCAGRVYCSQRVPWRMQTWPRVRWMEWKGTGGCGAGSTRRTLTLLVHEVPRQQVGRVDGKRLLDHARQQGAQRGGLQGRGVRRVGTGTVHRGVCVTLCIQGRWTAGSPAWWSAGASWVTYRACWRAS